MTYITHNDSDIDTNGTGRFGNLQATYKELTSLFGEPHTADDYKVDAEWDVQFDDGTVATIYNYKNGFNYCGKDGIRTQQITKWHVGGMSMNASIKVQITLDLMREGAADADGAPKDKVEAAFGSAFEIMDSIKAKRGQAYADAVEVALLIHKRIELFQMLVSALLDSGGIPSAAADAMGKIDIDMSARILGKVVGFAGVGAKDVKGAREIMEWSERVLDAERAGVQTLFGGLRSKTK